MFKAFYVHISVMSRFLAVLICCLEMVMPAKADGTNPDLVRDQAHRAEGLVAAPSRPEYVPGRKREQPSDQKDLGRSTVTSDISVDTVLTPAVSKPVAAVKAESVVDGVAPSATPSNGGKAFVAKPVVDTQPEFPVTVLVDSQGVSVVPPDRVSIPRGMAQESGKATLVATIEYQPASFSLDRTDHDILRQVARLRHQRGVDEAIHVVGHAASYSTALQRARSVVDVLQAQGIPATALHASAIVTVDREGHESQTSSDEGGRYTQIWFGY
ncbi:hypothetical protein HEQ63_02545 [Haematospirillum jordaniae]|uniref:hypothetical protein n=1 Tax=Haematospirillum jordaniae TaxID=1549855 RepID=UPI001433427F|nr:hypothetical protein [Haematospirillum jordaniae]NKD85068.1 hypothetical protein [Haematospirillum jordaniae]